MVKIKIKLLYILLSLFIFKSVSADESWYQTAANLHKKWAKTYHTVSDIERYTNIHKLVIGKDVELKPGKVFFPGYPNQVSLKAKISNGAMAKITGAPDFAYNGEEFNSFTADYSKCKKKEKQNDCTHHFGSVRTELVSKSSKWTFKEGTEKWINYAFMPGRNILFPKNPHRKYTIGQCHPSGHKITWMMTIQSAKLIFNHELSSFKNNNECFDIYDISTKDVIDGAKIVNKDEAFSKKYKLIVCSNVLEHVPYPSDLLFDILNTMDKDSILYIEVPLEDIIFNNEKDSHLRKKHWHEHINFYSEKSLKRLVENVMLEIVDLRKLKVTTGGSASYIFQVACRIKSN